MDSDPSLAIDYYDVLSKDGFSCIAWHYDMASWPKKRL